MDTGGLGIAYTRMNLVYENEQGQLWQCSNPDCKHMDFQDLLKHYRLREEFKARGKALDDLAKSRGWK